MIAWLMMAAGAPAAVCPPVRQGRPLQAVTLYDGPVAENAALAPDRSHKAAGALVQDWTVAEVYRQGRSLIVRCRYRGNAEVEVRPPGSVAGCRARWSRAENRLDCH